MLPMVTGSWFQNHQSAIEMGDPRSMAVGMSNSDLRGALLDRRTGDVLWRGEMYIRDVPDTENQRFEAAIRGMFQNLTMTEEVEQ